MSEEIPSPVVEIKTGFDGGQEVTLVLNNVDIVLVSEDRERGIGFLHIFLNGQDKPVSISCRDMAYAGMAQSKISRNLEAWHLYKVNKNVR